MGYWFGFSFLTLYFSCKEIKKQGYCKIFDVLSAIILILAGPFGFFMLLYTKSKDPHLFDRIIWNKKEKNYNKILEEYKKTRRKM